MPTTLMGVETECAIAAVGHDGRMLPTEQTVAHLMSVAAKSPAAVEQRRSPSNSMFLQNGARFYVDAGAHPEMTTPECTNPTDCVRYINAGEEFLVSLADNIKQKFAEAKEVSIYRCNVDYASGVSTWGCHESYLYRTNPAFLPHQMVPHFVSRLIFTGAGGFDSLHPGLRFTLSPRSHHLSGEVSRESQAGRGIFHTKDEALAQAGFHRMHVICGESVCSHKSAWLKLATTSLILALVDAGDHPGQGVTLQNPLKAMWSLSLDPTCTKKVKLHDGPFISALDLQRHYLQAVEARLGAPFMPTWAEDACTLWRSTLDALAQDPLLLSRTLDWPMKYALFTDALTNRGLTWETVGAWNDVIELALGAYRRESNAWIMLSPDALRSNGEDSAKIRDLANRLAAERKLDWDQYPEYWRAVAQLKETDLRFGQLGPDGLFNCIDAQPGVLDHRMVGRDSIATGISEPPAEGRAHVRGRLVRELASAGNQFTCDWQGVWDLTNHRFVDLSDPFAQSAEWEDTSTVLPDNGVEALSMLRARQGRRRGPVPGRESPIRAVLVRLREARRELRDRTDSLSLQLRTIETNIRDSGNVRVDTGRELNNLALEFRNEGVLRVAELLLRAALDIERDFYEPTHPKLPHRINNLASVMLLMNNILDSDALTREAWTLKNGRHDITSARILCLRVIIAQLSGTSPNVYIGQIKTLLGTRDGRRNDGEVAREWNFATPLESLRSRISPDEWALVDALVQSLNHPRHGDRLRLLPRWSEIGPVSLDHPWPDVFQHPPEDCPF